MTDSDTRVLIVGDIMTDLVAHVGHPPVPGSDVEARISALGGGSAANVAAWLATAGCAASLIARIGDDTWGREAEQALRGLGISVHLQCDRQRPTGTCIVLVGPDGERTMLPDSGANDALQPQDLPLGEFRAGRHLHVTGYTLMRDGSRAAALAALEIARAESMTVSVDASSVVPLERTGRERFLAWVGAADVCFANEPEAAALAGLPAEPGTAGTASRSLIDQFGLVVVKRGAHGAHARSADGREWQVPAAPARAVDTTGAGDAFAAGFLAAWTAGGDPGECLTEAATLAGRAVARVGGRP